MREYEEIERECACMREYEEIAYVIERRERERLPK